MARRSSDRTHQTAIVWPSRRHGTPSCYWTDTDFLADHHVRRADRAAPGTPSDGTQSSSDILRVSYPTLVLTVADVVLRLRRRIDECANAVIAVDDDEPGTDERQNLPSVGLPVAVCIPEGPLLPISVLAVHCLSEPFPLQPPAVPRNGSRTVCRYVHAVLVPIEPTADGRQRLSHMIRDSGPCLVLSHPRDMDAIHSVLSTVDRNQSRHVPSHNKHYRPFRNAQIVDFYKTVADACESRVRENLLRYTTARLRDPRHSDRPTCLRSTVLEVASLLSHSETNTADRPNSDFSSCPTDVGSRNRLSHMVYTSGTTGWPKGCLSSVRALDRYILAKNRTHNITETSTVLLASSLSFDPCFSDVLATFTQRATLAIAPRNELVSQLSRTLRQLHITHLLCTPTLFQLVRPLTPSDFPHLQLVALGGEAIPKSIRSVWGAVPDTDKSTAGNTPDATSSKLYATYGVTEATVYQTIGRVDQCTPPGFVGRPFRGMRVRICKEDVQDQLIPASTDGSASNSPTGEIVLYGDQIDEFSGYWNRNDKTHKFVKETTHYSQHDDGVASGNGECSITYYYRTGDRGFIDKDGNLRVTGRIQGEEGMLKVNGTRIELTEIEAALEDWSMVSMQSIVQSCIVVPRKNEHFSTENDGRESDADATNTDLHAYVVLTESCQRSAGITFEDCGNRNATSGYLVASTPLWELLRQSCLARLKTACIPSAFVVIPRIPLSPTGKRDSRKLPALEECAHLSEIMGHDPSSSVLLSQYGRTGAVVSKNIIECLNLQPSQQRMLTTSASFVMLGGDSLAATRVTRALYAAHHKVQNNRRLGGEFGTLDGPFNVSHILRASTLAEYVDMLDSHDVCREISASENRSLSDPLPETNRDATSWLPTRMTSERDGAQQRLYDALLQACTMAQVDVAIGLLRFGTDPNFGAHGGRLGKTSGRVEQKQTFRSSPLHLAASKGDPRLVRELLLHGAKLNTPDASGLYPLHLAAATSSARTATPSTPDDAERTKCVSMLLEHGAPITMRDGNKQSVLHCAARAGHAKVIEFVVDTWRDENDEPRDRFEPSKNHFFNWSDHWFRTPVHWAVLNGHVDALEALLRSGCHPDPPRPKMNKKSSAAVESPAQMCNRVHGADSAIGNRILTLLHGGG